MSNRLPRVLIVYNQPVLPAEHPDALSETDILETVAEVEKVLPASEFIVEGFGYARRPQQMLAKIDEWKPDVVFNLFEGEADRTATEAYHAAILEWADVPFTGSPSSALSLGRDKIRTKYLLQGAGVDTAIFQVADGLPIANWPNAWPAIVKPATQDASVGIDQGSVVTTQAQLEARVRHLFDRFGGPVLVEQFVPGREFHVHVIDDYQSGRPLVIPLSEVRFAAGSDYWPIYTYEGKWNESSVEYKNTALDTSVTLPPSLAERLEQVCLKAYRLVGMRDFGRVDVRVTPDGRPFVIEVNPNPHLNSIVLVDGLSRLGTTFSEFIQGMVGRAVNRPIHCENTAATWAHKPTER